MSPQRARRERQPGVQIRSARITPAPDVDEEHSRRGTQPRLHVSFDVENTTDAPQHVWASRRGYDYDPDTRLLTVQLAEPDIDLPPGITLISDHPRVPRQVIIEPGGRATLDVPVPTTVRRSTASQGLGSAFTEEPIEGIDQVQVTLQYADVPFQQIVEEPPAAHRRRMRAHGHVVRTTITPAEQKGQ